ncbi:hypothetical protein HBI25_050640 [Parastagonospora nodorum]|nr:hypothetical protein HBH51_119790 [Parastagonospora nodorum]KAH4195806.1 hypothetical protein HBH42_077190 [Parastagonospora nodorum]KAH5028473.1 hypothetical protein HBI75_135560 [Parastagonospora nodorum]KAH5074400.1 hypothetical protein HBH95_146210 [Parastagonospora nodorum]KAH5114477.1 hypothetical protein HBH71_141020 [Parastagonospora nodorum]
MAVLDDVPGLDVQIAVNGEVLREHQDRDAKLSEKTVERYVEAQSNANFEIRYAFKKGFPADRPVSMIVTIDGKDLDEPIIRPYELFEAKGHTSRGPISQQGGKWVVQPYCFAPIDIRECSTPAICDVPKTKLQTVGIITCGFYFLNNPKHNTNLLGVHKKLDVLPPISEKSIKGEALSHQAILGKTECTEEVEYFNADYADNGEPFATFHFYYRSLAALKDLHIIERTPDPLDLLEDDDTPVGQMNREQLEAIIRRFRERDDTRLRMKRERSSSETLVGDSDDIGDRHQHSDPDPDLLELRAVDLRAERKAKRVRQLPTPETEVIELDD